MLEGQLALAHVGEAGFIDERIGNRPGVARIELLVARPHVGAETGNIGSRRLKVIERLKVRIVSEVVVKAEILARVYVVIEAQSDLVLRIGTGRHRLIINAVRPVRSRDEAQHIDGNRILAGGRNRRVSAGVGGENTTPAHTSSRRLPTRRVDRRGTTGPAIERIRGKLVGDCATQGIAGADVENSRSLLRSRHGYCLSGNALPHATSFIGHKEKRAVL